MKIDISRLKEIAGDDRELILSLFSLFLESYNGCIEKMQKSLEIKNTENSMEEWKAAAHELKGSAYNLGFSDLGDFCTAAEGITDKDNMQEAIEMFEVQLKEVEEFMDKY